ncbi:glycosyltransferase family 4 protein [Jatrophihabitans sp. DSM 45814]
MRILVFPASLNLGGSQLNAVQLAGAISKRGHDVSIFGPEGPLCDEISALGLPFIPAPARPKVRPSPHVISKLNQAVATRDIEVVHGYEWPPILEAVYGPFLRHNVVPVGTIMSMGVAPFIPQHLHLVVGTAQIAAAERVRRSNTWLIEPPVDTDADRPMVDNADARAQLGATTEEFLVVVVSRLARELKREGILEAINAAARMAGDLPIRMVIVGDGPARAEIEERAAAANVQAGRQVVVLLGALSDPRPAYAAADVAFGMGSSALRAMAFAKPLIVQGERGFWMLLTPESEATFLEQGWYGIGDGRDGSHAFELIVRDLYKNPEARAELARFARQLVVDRFSLDRAAQLQEEVYRQAVSDQRGRIGILPSFVRPAGQVMAYEVQRRWARARGTAVSDDFNALKMQPGAPTPKSEERH